ncbi:MAG: hypothetical protein IM600_03765 [Bacteroidetes bacterium]|nr:hypothetical protein [Bacteroidota bacterium]MCA6442526.1 hypothetical protein [Bacteroidota bacterium]
MLNASKINRFRIVKVNCNFFAIQKTPTWQGKEYCLFGAPMPGRNFNAGDYRYGFSGMENDNEVKGTGNSIAFESRIYDPRLGRWLSIDPLFKDRPFATPYQFCSNNPIFYVDPDGNSEKPAIGVNNNTGNLVILIRKDGDPPLSIEAAKDYATGWDIVQVDNFSQAEQWIKDNYKVGEQRTEIVKLVIATHSQPLSGGANNKDNAVVMGTKKNGFLPSADANTLGSRGTMEVEDNVKSKVSNFAKSQLNSLDNIISNYTSKTSSIYFLPCFLAKDNNADQWAGFLNQGGDRTIYLNGDPSSNIVGRAKVGGSSDYSTIVKSGNMTSMDEFETNMASGWTKYKYSTSSGGGVSKTGSNVLLFDGKNGKIEEKKTYQGKTR